MTKSELITEKHQKLTLINLNREIFLTIERPNHSPTIVIVTRQEAIELGINLTEQIMELL